MDLLLDTHAFLWFVSGDVSLSIDSRKRITDLQNRCYVSVASFWEISIKLSLGKLELSITPEELIAQVGINGFELLPVTPEHTLRLMALPMHHKDPFDRMLIAQATTENMTILSRDSHFVSYPVAVLW